MSIYDVRFRLTLYAPRDVDDTEATVLTPRSGAAHSDNFKIATASGVSGFQPYMGLPNGRQGTIEPLSKRTTTGQLTIPLFDVRTTAGGSNLTRWVTAFIGDDIGRNRLLGCKVLIEQDIGSGWNDYFTGRVETIALDGKQKYRLTVRDMAEELNCDVFTNPPDSNISYSDPTPIWPTGLIGAYANLPTIKKVRVKVMDHSLFNYSWLQLYFDDSENQEQYRHNILTSAWPNFTMMEYGPLFHEDYNVRIRAEIVHDASNPGAGREGEIGDYVFVRWGALKIRHDGMWGASGFIVRSTTVVDPNQMDLPDTDDELEIYVYVLGEASEERPILIDDVHPCQLWKDLLDGHLGRRDEDGDPLRVIGYDSTAFAALIADTSIPTQRFYIDRTAKLSDWQEKYICQVLNLSWRLNEQGEVVPLDMRLPNSLGGFSTISESDLDTEHKSGWEQSRASAITAMEATYYSDFQRPQEDILESGEKIPSIPSVRIEEKENRIRLQDFGAVGLGEKAFRLDAKGFRLAADEKVGNINRREWVQRQLEGLLRSLRGPFGTGASYAMIRCRRTAVPSATKQGDFVIVDADVLPDPASTQRGGARFMLCVQRRDDGPRIELRCLDMGPNTVAVTPTIATPTQQTGNTKHGLSVSITVNASSEPVRLEYVVTPTATGTRPDEDDAGWTFSQIVTATGSVDIEKLPSGMRVWVRARTEPQTESDPKLPSAWVLPASTGYVDLATLTAPTSLTSSGKTGSTADLSWSNGETEYETEVLLVLGGTPGSWSDDDLVATLPPGSTEFTLRGLDGPSTAHTAAVRHRDPYGGTSSENAHNFSTTATDPTAPRPAGIGAAILQQTLVAH